MKRSFDRVVEEIKRSKTGDYVLNSSNRNVFLIGKNVFSQFK